MGISDEELDFSDEDQLQDNELQQESDDPEESESDSEDDEDVRQAEPAKEYVYNRDVILDKLGDISWPQDLPWTDKLTLDITQQQEVDVNDDLARELAFYTQALEGTREAFGKLQGMGIPFLRPSDYYAEMVKTDAHMGKVKNRLLTEKQKIEEAEERKKARESKKLAKEIQIQKQKERTKQKKEEIENVKKWRKQRQKSGFSDKDNDMPPLDFGENGKGFERANKKRPGVRPGDRSGGKSRFGGGGDKKFKKRERKDSKFGYGGRKGMKKQNTADTTNDIRDFKKGSAPVGNKRQKR